MTARRGRATPWTVPLGPTWVGPPAECSRNSRVRMQHPLFRDYINMTD